MSNGNSGSNGATKPLYRSGTFYIGAGGLTLLSFAEELGALPDKLLWPMAIIVTAMILARGFADFGKYSH